MQGFVDTDGGFSGNKRQKIISELLFGMLCGDPMTDIFEWLEYTIGWDSSFSSDEETLFASLARAVPNAGFRFNLNCYYYDYSGWYHCIDFSNGKLNLTSHEQHYVAEYNEDDENEENEENDEDDEDEENDEDECSTDETLFEMSDGRIVGEVLSSFECEIDKKGNFIGNSGYMLQACIELEKKSMSDLLNLIETGTEDPDEMVKLGILFETGLAGLDKNLEKSWDYYLKAAETENENAVKIVREIFDDENKEELHELLKNKCISKESFDRFFELALEDHNVELTAKLLEYKAALK